MISSRSSSSDDIETTRRAIFDPSSLFGDGPWDGEIVYVRDREDGNDAAGGRVSSGRRRVMDHSTSVAINTNWMLRFYIHKDRKSFEILAKAFGEIAGYATARSNGPRDLMKWIRDNIDNIMIKMRATSHNANLVSLCCYSGPTESSATTCEVHTQHLLSHSIDYFQPGWLGLGDIPLQRSWASLRSHYSSVWPRIGSVTVPHHGSKHNHEPALYKSGILRAAICHDQPSRHPASIVLSDIHANGLIQTSVTQHILSAFIQEIFI